MENRARLAVGRFVAHAIESRGGVEQFIAAIRIWAGPVGTSTVYAWRRGENDPDAWLLFLIAREWRLSLDEYAMSEEDRRSLLDQLRELRERMERLEEPPATLPEPE
jgi:hypothetical protein